ncbi:thioredoxin [bacterium]|nr:thioredoxin [bacterium]
MAIKAVIHTNQSSIDRVLGAGVPVVLAFWSPQSTVEDDPMILETLAVDFAGRALLAKVNAQDEAALMSRFDVKQAPSFVFVKDQRAVATVPGPLTEETLRSWLRHLVEGAPRPQTTQTGPKAKGHNGNGHSRQAPGAPVHLTDATFEQAINSDLPVLVDFWAEWCGPCRTIAPSLERLAQEFAGRAVVAKLNIDQNPRTPQRFGIMSIPTLYIFKNGRVVDQIVGAQPLPALRQWLSRHA